MSLVQATNKPLAVRDYPRCDHCTRLATHFGKNYQRCAHCQKKAIATTRKGRK